MYKLGYKFYYFNILSFILEFVLGYFHSNLLFLDNIIMILLGIV
jgi:hypothetical protein